MTAFDRPQPTCTCGRSFAFTASKALTSNSYDSRNRLTSALYGNGQRVNYKYDSLDRPVIKYYNNDDSNSTGYHTVYNASGLVGLHKESKMGLSWSAMRKILEQENICDSLKRRVQYFVTRYSKSTDQEGRVAIRLDGKEVFKSCFYDWARKRDEAWGEINAEAGRKTSYLESGAQMESGALNRGGFDQYAFYNAFYTYQNSSIDENLISPDPVVRLFAIMDRRVGKRRLQTLALEVEKQPEWLQEFYRLRLAAEGVWPAKRAN